MQGIDKAATATGRHHHYPLLGCHAPEKQTVPSQASARHPWVEPVIQTLPFREGLPAGVSQEWSGESLRDSNPEPSERTVLCATHPVDRGSSNTRQDSKSRSALVAANQSIGAPPIPRRRGDLHVEELDGEAILFDARAGAIHRLNASSLSVWMACSGSRTINDIALMIQTQYMVDAVEAQQSVRSIVQRFDDRGLVRSERPSLGGVAGRLKRGGGRGAGCLPRLRAGTKHRIADLVAAKCLYSPSVAKTLATMDGLPPYLIREWSEPNTPNSKVTGVPST